jgi:drug/metabolite transporter (DMT)-like permease
MPLEVKPLPGALGAASSPIVRGFTDVALWGKTSDVWTFAGAAIIVAATTYIAHREARTGGRNA